MNGRERFHILEAGFGTGLNLLLLIELLQGMDKPPDVTYRSIEAFPLSEEQAAELNYPACLKLTEDPDLPATVFRNLNPGLNIFKVNKLCTLELFIGTPEQMPTLTHPCEAIFFDPFSPEANPDFWTPEIFRFFRSVSSNDVILSTYCAATAARAAMSVAGWHPFRMPGILGKREMTVATLEPVDWKDGTPAYWQGGTPVNRERLIERYQNGEFSTS